MYTFPQVEVRIYLKEIEGIVSEEPIRSTWDAVKAVRREMADLDREKMIVVNLSTAGKPINWNAVATGGLNSSSFWIPNLFKAAILSNAYSLIMFHNHPGGTLEPSEEDLSMTSQIIEAAKLLGIRVLDHIIVAGPSGDYYSMRENGYIS